MHELKEVSRAKHQILISYFSPWARILGQYHDLVYVDCFAGPGKYEKDIPGSPLLIYGTAKNLVKSKRIKNIHLIFIEKSRKYADELKENLDSIKDETISVKYSVYHEDAKDFIETLLKQIPMNAAAFYFIDPYGHPISFPVIKRILQRPKSEVFLNLMWFSINKDLDNPKEKEPLNKMFGHSNWQNQQFMAAKGEDRQKLFLEYVFKEIGAKYPKQFRIRFSPEDQISSGKTKYYLVHFSNHYRAAFIMKDVMHSLGDEEGTFEYSASRDGILFSKKPELSELKEFLIHKYCGKGIKKSFLELQIDTYDLPFVEKEYRAAIKEMEGNQVEVKRIKSKRTGIANEDIILFK